MNDRIKVEIPNEHHQLDWVHAITSKILERLPLSDRRKYYLLVAVSEGVTNAFVHGNQQQPDRTISVDYVIDEESVRVDIQDEGILPIHNNIEHLIRPAEADAESGRGLVLVRQFSDESSLRHDPQKGNILTMITYFGDKSGDQDFSHGEVANGLSSNISR
jgi:anti-sigma regulatory factor (Ser/Thr protein kinase)